MFRNWTLRVSWCLHNINSVVITSACIFLSLFGFLIRARTNL